MANDQEMKLKSQKHYTASLQRSLKSGKKDDSIKIGPVVLGILLFVVVGSSVFQLFNSMQGSSDILI